MVQDISDGIGAMPLLPCSPAPLPPAFAARPFDRESVVLFGERMLSGPVGTLPSGRTFSVDRNVLFLCGARCGLGAAEYLRKREIIPGGRNGCGMSMETPLRLGGETVERTDWVECGPVGRVTNRGRGAPGEARR